jgi:hypothetical protein
LDAWLLERDGRGDDLFTSKLSPETEGGSEIRDVGGRSCRRFCSALRKGILITIDYFRRGVIAMDILNNFNTF